MPSNKMNRINEDIRLCLSNLLREIKDPRIHQGLISITGVDATGDLKYCKVYVSILGDVNEKEFNKGIKSATGWIRRELGHRMKLRNTPELIFTLDHSIEEGAHINEIIASLNIQEDEDEQDIDQ